MKSKYHINILLMFVNGGVNALLAHKERWDFYGNVTADRW